MVVRLPHGARARSAEPPKQRSRSALIPAKTNVDGIVLRRAPSPGRRRDRVHPYLHRRCTAAGEDADELRVGEVDDAPGVRAAGHAVAVVPETKSPPSTNSFSAPIRSHGSPKPVVRPSPRYSSSDRTIDQAATYTRSLPPKGEAG
jgi:hypothetical protein